MKQEIPNGLTAMTLKDCVRDLQNPCNSSALRKIFREQKAIHCNILEKEVVDEIVLRTENPRNRLMLELMARGGMRVGEVFETHA